MADKLKAQFEVVGDDWLIRISEGANIEIQVPMQLGLGEAIARLRSVLSVELGDERAEAPRSR